MNKKEAQTNGLTDHQETKPIANLKKVTSAMLHSATMLPGSKTESTLNATKIPGIEMYWIQNEGLLVKVKDKKALIPAAGVKVAYLE